MTTSFYPLFHILTDFQYCCLVPPASFMILSLRNNAQVESCNFHTDIVNYTLVASDELISSDCFSPSLPLFLPPSPQHHR